MIITAYNEEKRIKAKLDNSLTLRYPAEKLQILLASDGSTDQPLKSPRATRRIVLIFVDISKRGGKKNAQKEAVKKATAEVIFHGCRNAAGSHGPWKRSSQILRIRDRMRKQRG